jgi:protein-disulfide isomerase
VTIVEYGDMACPACKSASEDLIPTLIERYVRPGDVKMEFRPIAFISQSSERGALGVEAAGLQDRMWSLVSLLSRNQGAEEDDWLSDDLLEEAAEKAGLDMERWRADYAGDEVATTFFDRSNAASDDGVNATPTFFVKGPRGQQQARTEDEFADAIEAVGPAS